jgi:hypothetical protein
MLLTLEGNKQLDPSQFILNSPIKKQLDSWINIQTATKISK